MTALLISGYRSFELGIFEDRDPRVGIIKKAIKRDLSRFFEEGVDWLIFTGNLGFEYWALEVAKELQDSYDFSIATLFLFEDQGSNWNERNQEKLVKFKTVDFVKYSFSHYENPSQFKQHQNFLIENTQAIYLFYDEENETNLKYLNRHVVEEPNYQVFRLDFERLNEIAQEE